MTDARTAAPYCRGDDPNLGTEDDYTNNDRRGEQDLVAPRRQDGAGADDTSADARMETESQRQDGADDRATTENATRPATLDAMEIPHRRCELPQGPHEATRFPGQPPAALLRDMCRITQAPWW